MYVARKQIVIVLVNLEGQAQYRRLIKKPSDKRRSMRAGSLGMEFLSGGADKMAFSRRIYVVFGRNLIVLQGLKPDTGS